MGGMIPGIPRVGAGHGFVLGSHDEDADPGPGLLQKVCVSFIHTLMIHTVHSYSDVATTISFGGQLHDALTMAHT